MKKLIFICIMTTMSFFTTYGQSKTKIISKSIDEFTHIKINKLIYYETPYTTVYNKPIEKSYKPSWYLSYCALNYPLGFKDYKKEANPYILKKKYSEQELEAYENKFKNLKKEEFLFAYQYYYGEIYFTDIKSKKEYILLLKYSLNKKISNLDFGGIISKNFKLPKDERNINDDFNTIYDSPMTFKLFILDNKKFKEIDNSEIQKVFKIENILFMKSRLDYFYEMLNRSEKYIKSNIINGKRIFETIKKTE